MAIFLACSPYIHSCFNLSTTATSQQWPLSSVPKVAVVEMFKGSTCVPELRVVVNRTMIVASLACACTWLLCHQTLWPHTRMWTDLKKLHKRVYKVPQTKTSWSAGSLSPANIVQWGFAQGRIILLRFFCQRMNALPDKLRNSIFPNLK